MGKYIIPEKMSSVEIYNEIKRIESLIRTTRAMSEASYEDGGISKEKAEITIKLFEMDIENLKKELKTKHPIEYTSKKKWWQFWK